MAQIQRKYNFANGTRSDAEQVDEEFDNLINAHNQTDTELVNHASKQVNPADGDLTRDKHVSNNDLKNLQDQITGNDNDISSLQLNKADKTSVYTRTELFTKNELQSIASGNSGATKIKISAISGISADDVQAAIEGVNNKINQTVLGQIPDGSITEIKLAFDPATQEEFATHQAEKASKTAFGHVQVGDGINVTDGVISVAEMTASNVSSTDGNVQTDIDNLKSSVSSGKQSVRDTITGNGGTVSDADADGVPTFSELVTGVNSIPKGAKVKSIQKGLELFTSAIGRYITINSVDMNKTIVKIRVRTNSSADVHWRFEGYLTSATQLYLKRNTDTTLEVYVEWEVIEYESGVNIQRGRYYKASSNTSQWFDISISPVNVEKSIIEFSASSNWNDSPQVNELTAIFLNSSTIRFQRMGGNADVRYIPWYVIEYL